MSAASPPPEPPDEGPGPAFPGFKMGMGAPERVEAPPGQQTGELPRMPAPATWGRRSSLVVVAFWIGVLVAAALIAWIVLG